MSICQNCCDPLASLTYLKWPHAGDMTTVTPGHMATGDRAITVQKESVKPADMDDDEIISFWKTPHIEDRGIYSLLFQSQFCVEIADHASARGKEEEQHDAIIP